MDKFWEQWSDAIWDPVWAGAGDESFRPAWKAYKEKVGFSERSVEERMAISTAFAAGWNAKKDNLKSADKQADKRESL